MTIILEAIIYFALLLATFGICLCLGLAIGILLLRRQPRVGGRKKHNPRRGPKVVSHSMHMPPD